MIAHEIKESVRNHISEIPVVESHYIRNRTSKLYFDETLNMKKVHDLYEEWMQEKYPHQTKATLRQYRDIFNTEFNIDFHKPKKDLCPRCDIFRKAGEIEKLNLSCDQSLHLATKTVVRTLKDIDKKRSEESTSVVTVCYDLQKILATPQSEVSLFYYKRKLAVYNFTLFEVGTREGHCYLWDETIGKTGSNEISSFVYDFIKKAVEREARKEFIFYSDSCGGQNRNRTVFAMYSKATRYLMLI